MIIFKVPYYGIYELTKLCGEKQREVWNRLPFRNLLTPTLLPDGNIIICSLEDHNLEWDIYHKSPYDHFKPKKGDVVVDAGAHVGFYTLKAAKAVGGDGRVIAIEPEDKNYKLLTLNIRINKYRNVTPIKKALSNFDGKARFFLKARSCSHSLIRKTWITPIVGSTKVSVTTLDNLFEKLNITKVDILKINVEGAELAVLKGCKRFLADGRIFKIVATPHPPFEREAKKISNYLETFGYKIKVAGNVQYLYAVLS